MVCYACLAAFRKVEDCVLEEEKEFEDLGDLLVSFRLYFVVVGDSYHILVIIMYYLLL
jgi:hypothetical protein